MNHWILSLIRCLNSGVDGGREKDMKLSVKLLQWQLFHPLLRYQCSWSESSPLVMFVLLRKQRGRLDGGFGLPVRVQTTQRVRVCSCFGDFRTLMHTLLYISKYVKLETAIELNSKHGLYSKDFKTSKLSCFQHFWPMALHCFTGGLCIVLRLCQRSAQLEEKACGFYHGLCQPKHDPRLVPFTCDYLSVMLISEWLFCSRSFSKVPLPNAE